MARFDENQFFDSGIRYDEPDNHNPLLPRSSMRDLHHYLENPFDDDGISVDELSAFTTDHLQRLIANNPGALYNTRITATTTAWTVVANCTSSDQTKLGLRKARKMVKDTFRKELPEKVARIAASVVAKYGPNGAQVTECFPQGRKVFSDCTDDMVSAHLQTLIAGVAAHQADLGAAVVADAGGLLSSWLVVYGASELSTGAKTTTQEAMKTARQNLQLELFKNLLTIALNHPRLPDDLNLFMQQHLLEDHPAAAPTPPTPPTP